MASMFGEYARMLEARTYDGDTCGVTTSVSRRQRCSTSSGSDVAGDRRLSRTYPRRLYAALMTARDTVST